MDGWVDFKSSSVSLAVELIIWLIINVVGGNCSLVT